MTNSRAKGKRGELEWASFLRDEGWEARRGQQFSGLEGEDVVCSDLPQFHFEVKRTERFNAYDAMEQAQQDARSHDTIPVVAHKKNHREWLVVMYATDWAELVRESE